MGRRSTAFSMRCRAATSPSYIPVAFGLTVIPAAKWWCWTTWSMAPTCRQKGVVGDNHAGQLDHAVALSAPAGQYPDPLLRLSGGPADRRRFALRRTDARHGGRHRRPQDRAEQPLRQRARYRGGPDLRAGAMGLLC